MSDIDWQTDWLYVLIFRETESLWKAFHQPSNPRFVYIAEWSSTDGIHCRGRVINTWIRDEQGLRKIGSTERIKIMIRSVVSRSSRSVDLSFHIYADRKRVIIDQQFHIGYLGGGYGGVYLVEGTGAFARFEKDPSGGFWMI